MELQLGARVRALTCHECLIGRAAFLGVGELPLGSFSIGRLCSQWPRQPRLLANLKTSPNDEEVCIVNTAAIRLHNQCTFQTYASENDVVQRMRDEIG